MSRFTMDFQCDNAAFGGGYTKEEVARILEHTALRLRLNDDEGKVFDINGNKVGSWSLDIDEEEEEE